VYFVDPALWTDSHITKWLQWAIQEFHLENINMNNFRMNGQTLVKMPKEEFLQLAPPFMGDILLEHIECLQKGMYHLCIVNSCNYCIYLNSYVIFLS
jgi:hypothetical protein